MAYILELWIMLFSSKDCWILSWPCLLNLIYYYFMDCFYIYGDSFIVTSPLICKFNMGWLIFNRSGRNKSLSRCEFPGSLHGCQCPNEKQGREQWQDYLLMYFSFIKEKAFSQKPKSSYISGHKFGFWTNHCQREKENHKSSFRDRYMVT